MKTSENIDALAAALCKAQLAMKNAGAASDNPFFKSKYAELHTVRDTVTPHLAANGIAVVQGTAPGEGQLIVHTRLIHSSGQWIESQYPIMNDLNKPQAMGSAYTYARRYSLSAICGIASEKDDDGNAAEDHGKVRKDQAGPHSIDKVIKRDPKSDMARIKGTVGASKAALRDSSQELQATLHGKKTTEECLEWILTNEVGLNALPPDWVYQMEVLYEEHKALCRGKVAA